MLYASILIFSSLKIMSDFSDQIMIRINKIKNHMKHYREILMLTGSLYKYTDAYHHSFISRIYSPNSSHNHSAGLNIKNHVADQ